jgi:GNAT superfamily N-acetyltransferase
VGKRVSVRQLVKITDGHPTFTDTVGVLASWDAGVVCVTRRTGETVRIAESALVAGKVVPPAPVRPARPAPAGIEDRAVPSASAVNTSAADAPDPVVTAVPRVTPEEIEEIASRAWPATETARLGDWTLRAAAGFTRRANSVLAVGEPGVPLDQALTAVARWYESRRLTPWVQVPDGSPYATALEARGWAREGDAVLRTAPLAPLLELPAEGVTLSRTPDAAWIAAYHRTGSLAEAALKVVSGGPSVWFASIPGAMPTAGTDADAVEGAGAVPAAGPVPRAIGRAVVDGPWVLFGAVEVTPSSRRRGLATTVMGALARQAHAEGATAVYLQVEADNDAARALYDRLGFTDHHRYHYRRP